MDQKALFNLLEANTQSMISNLSVDCVIFTIQEGKLKVLLTKLLPKLGWMLPGGFINKDEAADIAANRVLFQRTGVDNIYLHQFKIFSDPDRFSFQAFYDKLENQIKESVDLSKLSERVISIGYFALVDFESIHLTGGMFDEVTKWTELKLLPDLMFDHLEIINEALKALRKELHFKPIASNLLPEKFTMPELQSLYEIILDRLIERSSFQKRVLKWDIYERLEEKREGVAHKRPFLYRFDAKKYDIAISQGIRFGI